ncbi:MAG: CPBP family glutamic-type intramembrane protease [Bacteroidota bacterium]
MNPHYVALMITYASIAGVWFLLDFFVRKPWNIDISVNFRRPWLEFVYALVAVVAILGIGQLYIGKMLIPNAEGNTAIDALNQFLIFSPTILLLIIRRQPLESIWLPPYRIAERVGWGLILSVTALLIYWLARKDAVSLSSLFTETYHPKNFSFLVQVFMEDITIALLFVRLSAWIGRRWSIGIVAALFAAGHIPSLLADGATLNELSSLLLDVTIGVIILSAVSKSKDVWWFFPVHFVMDMTQFYGGAT